jgi:hypothetical protein
MTNGHVGNRVPLVLLATVAWIINGCGGKTVGFDVDLQREVYASDFGSASGTLPEIACSTSGDPLCDQLPVVRADTSAATGAPSNATVVVACDTQKSRCFAQVSASVFQSVDVRLDPGFKGTLEGRLITFVKVLDLTYSVPSNTLTFAVPAIHVFVGPAGVTRETDDGVVAVGSTPLVPAGATVEDGHLAIDDASPARSTIENAIRRKQTFVFVLVFTPRIASGDPIPAGAIEVDLTPKLTIGL